MKTKIILIAAICTFAHLHICTFANNLSIKTGSVTGSSLTFTISWDNSWKNKTTDAPNNYDAVWVFVKYRDCDTTKKFGWNHAKLSPTSADHKIGGTELTVDAVSDSNGVFIRRNAVDTGNIAAVQCTLKLVSPATAGTYSFRVFGVEMVNIPQGNFDVGDGTSASSFNAITISSATQAATLTKGTLGGGASTADVPSAYPMGYNSFYCMKYEVTQEQYVDFLNTLTYDQAASRTTAVPNSPKNTYALKYAPQPDSYVRNGIYMSNAGFAFTVPKYPATYTTSNPNVPCNNMNWGDLTAYLDWACLRPMTDLEFEKICRGPLARIDREFIWGASAQNSSPTQAMSYYSWSSKLNNPNTATETSQTSGNGLCAYGNTWCNGGCDANLGPIRVGFSATASTDRVKSGSAYYGVMDMAGNIWERVVAVNTTGVVFTGKLGNGVLDASGNSDVANWPVAAGIGYRGGSWYDASQYLQTSDRTYAASGDAGRDMRHGGRGVR